MSDLSRLPDRPDAATVADWADQYAHVVALLALLAYMGWTRVRGWGRFVDGGQVLFQSNDAWYHYRQVSYTVRHFPRTMPFDPWTAYPTGADVGQFGTIFDQTVALAALVVGAGNPNETTVGLTLLFAPAVLGTLVAVPTYLLGRHAAGRVGGIVAVTVLALTPGGFLQRTRVGFADHHAAEVLLQVTAMLAVVAAVRAAEQHDPAVDGLRVGPFVERLRVREVGTFRRPLVFAVISGVAVAGYVLVWPPGVFLGLVLGVFYAVHVSAEFVRGRDPDHVAAVGIVSALTTAVVTLAGSSSAGFEPIAVSLLQPALFVCLAAGLVGAVALSRAFESRSLPKLYYPGVLVALGVLLVVVVRLVSPARFAFFADYFLRVFGYTLTGPAQSVSETRPIAPGSVGTFLRLSYGFAYGGALLGAALGVVGYWRDATSREWLERRPAIARPVVALLLVTTALYAGVGVLGYANQPRDAATGWLATHTDGNATIETYVTDPQEAPVPHGATIYRPTQRAMTVDGERVRPSTTRWMRAMPERCPTYIVLNAHESLQYLAPDDYSRRAALLANPERERYVRDLLSADTYPYEVATRFGPEPRYLRSERRPPVWRAVVNAGVFPRSVQYGDGQDLGTDQYTIILARTGECDPAETSPLR